MQGHTSPPRAGPGVRQQQQPIKDAVNDAFIQSPTTNQLDHDFVKRLTEQVTENVLKSLQAANIAPPLPQTVSPSAVDPPGSPTRESLESLPSKYTPPPSPHRDRTGARGSPSPERAASDAGSGYSGYSSYSRDSQDTNHSRRSRAGTLGSRETIRPGQAHIDHVVDGYSTRKDEFADVPSYPRKASGADATSLPTRRDSRGVDDPNSDASPRRRVSSTAAPTGGVEEETPLEKTWQPLFVQGNPTARLGQFLRGLAKHLIDDWEPKGSLVVTPSKMMRFFDETKVTEEHYPWHTIFGGRMTSANMSKMYQKLLCQHHLIQQQHHETPSVPGLTPTGFEALMACLIQAHPETEYARLTKSVKNMPISNADDKTERFPKELSRRLLPGQASVQAEQRLIASLNHEPLVQLPRSGTAMPPPPPSVPLQASFNERERNPYASNTQRSNAVDDDDLSPPSMPLERERKPYYGKGGTGKIYDNDNDRDRDRDRDREWDSNRPTATQQRPEMPGVRPNRNNSGLLPQAMYPPASEPVNVPPPTSRHRLPVDRNAQPPLPIPTPLNASYPRARRTSPPRRSDIDAGSYQPSQPPANIPPGSMRDRVLAEGDEEPSRSKSRRPPDRNVADEDPNTSRGFPIPPRNPPQGSNGYDPIYASGPPGSFGQRGGPSHDEPRRRNTWYSANGNEGHGPYPLPSPYGPPSSASQQH